jgi:hypothetical protein
MQPAMRAFWRAYVMRMDLDSTRAARCLQRAARYAATRLLQTAYERTYGAAHVTPDAVCLLQMSLNILQRPEEAVMHLLGIPWWQASTV